MMVKVARQKLEEMRTPTRPALRMKRTSLDIRCIREDHYALLLAAQY